MTIKTIEKRNGEERTYTNVKSAKINLHKTLFVNGKDFTIIELRNRKGEKITALAVEDYEIEIISGGVK